MHIDRIPDNSILGKDIVNYRGGYDLKKRGTTLTEENIGQLKSQGYQYILITDKMEQQNEFESLNQISTYRNTLINKFVSEFRDTVIDEQKYRELRLDELLTYKQDSISRTYFEKIANDTIPNDFTITLYKEIGNIFDLIESMDEIKINLTENRNQKVNVFDHMVDCGIYYLAMAIELLRWKDIQPKIEHKNAVLRGALGAMLHDIGYLHKKLLNIYNEILETHQLSDAYDKRLYKHILISANIISALSTPYISEAKTMCKEHHCYEDGSGIPKDMKPSIEASRILSVIDNYDILTNEWFGRKMFNRQSVLQFIDRNKIILFNFEITEAFFKIILPYAIGEKIVLCDKNNKKLFYAEVKGYKNNKTFLPEVIITETTDGKKIDPPRIKDLNDLPNIIIGELSDYLIYK